MAVASPADPASPPPPIVHRERDRPVTDLFDAADDAARLIEAGIPTLHALEGAAMVDLAKATRLTQDRIRDLQAEARLMDVAGIGPRVAHALVAGGILTIPQLAKTEFGKVALAVAQLSAGPDAQPTPEGTRNAKAWVRAARNHPATRPDAPPPPAPPAERIVVIPTRLYWTVLGLSLLFLFLAVGFYRDYLDNFLFGVSLLFYYATLALAIVAIAWCTFGLLRRGRVVHRTTSGTKALVTGVAEGFRERSEDNEGAMEAFATRWSNRFGALGRAVVWIVKLPFRIIIWAWYTSEKLVWRVVLILYDIVYYPTYTAWLLALWAIRTSLRIVQWALGVAWKVVRLPLFLPGLRGMWRRKMRPQILAQWRAAAAARKAAYAKRLERGRRLAQVRGENPDRWEADYRLRRAFPLPHPEKGRVRIRKRIRHISEVQAARREGRPIPRSGSGDKPRFRLGRGKDDRASADEPLDFLSADLRRRIETILADGKVDEDERRNLVEAIEGEAALTPDQKDRVRKVVESWSTHDRAAPA